MKKALTILSLIALSTTVSAQLKTFFVRPTVTDAGYAAAQDSHYVAVNKSVTALNKLLVFLPGTGAQAKHYQLFPRLAANMGYHCINLAYPNAQPAASCASTAAQDCYTKFRQEVCYGTPGSDEVTVDTLNSIYTRLVKTLTYLNAAYPSDGWAQYLSAGKPVWNKIATSGHSQGSGHALYLSKANAVDRVIMFAGPQDYNYVSSNTAPWISAAGVTPTSRLYSLLHLQDEVSPYTIQYKALTAMGLLASDDSTSVDLANPPYSSSHCLYTNLTPLNSGINGAFHNSMVVDFYTPGNTTTPVLTPVWTYMLSNSSGNGISDNNPTSELLVYPNPSSGKFTINYSMLSQTENLEIVNSLGQVVYARKLEKGSNRLDIDLVFNNSGIYFVRIGNTIQKLSIR